MDKDKIWICERIGNPKPGKHYTDFEFLICGLWDALPDLPSVVKKKELSNGN